MSRIRTATSVEIVGYQRIAGRLARPASLCPPPASPAYIMHVGVLVGDLAKSSVLRRQPRFQGVLARKQFPQNASWVNMRVPEGDDYLEFMLLQQASGAGRPGHQESRSLTIPTRIKLRGIEEAAGEGSDTPGKIVIQTGVNRKRQINSTTRWNPH